MKICSKCQEEKELDQFNKRSDAKDGLQHHCKQCNKETLIKHYQCNKEKYQKRDIRYRQSIRSFVNSMKAEKGCSNCDEKDPSCLDFHHLRDKVNNIATMVAKDFSKESLQKEIAKCIILCSNCHRKLHHNGL